jgi:alkaline phosphatase
LNERNNAIVHPWLSPLHFITCFSNVLGTDADVLRPSQENNQWFLDGVSTLNKHLSQQPNHNPAKNAIIFIGDGCDIATNTAARIFKGQQKGQTGEEGFLSYEKFPYTGLSKTYNTNHQVSDSASTANAILTGVKTNSCKYNISW